MKVKNGVSCDLCDMILNINFVYYSFDLIETDESAITCFAGQLSINISGRSKSFDVCNCCYDNITKLIISNYNCRKVNCELCSQNLKGKCYYVVVSEVKVVNNNLGSVDKRIIEFKLCSLCAERKLNV